MTFSMFPPTSCSSTPPAHKRKSFRKSWASETRKCAGSLLPWSGGQTTALQGFGQWKWSERGICLSWGQELRPVPGTRVLFIPGAHTLCLSLLRKPAFPSHLPKGGASTGSRPWMGLHFPAGPSPGSQLSVSILEEQLWQRPWPCLEIPFPLLSQTKLIWNGWVHLTFFPIRNMCSCEGGSPRDSPQAVCLESTSLPNAGDLQCIQRHASGMERDLGARFLGNGWKIWGCSGCRRENSGRSWEVSQWAVTTRQVYSGIAQRKTETNVEKLQGGKLP